MPGYMGNILNTYAAGYFGGFYTVATPTITDPEVSPATADAAWGLSRMLIAQWAEGCTVVSTWPVQVAAAYTAAEKRVCGSNRPRRTLRFTLESDGPAAAWHVRNMLLRFGYCRALVPLYPDYTVLTAPAAGSTLTCDTTLRRFYPGAVVAIGEPAAGTVPYAAFATGVVQSVTPAGITLTAAVAQAWPAGSRVVPLLLCDVQANPSARSNAGGRATATVQATEVSGPTALPPLADPGDTTTLWAYDGSYPIFWPGLSRPGRAFGWRTTGEGWRRDSRTAIIGSGSVWELLGPRPRGTSDRTAVVNGRADAWPVVQFWDLVRGPTFPFYAPSTYPLAPPLAITATTIAMPAAGPLADWQAYPYAVVMGIEPAPSSARVVQVLTATRSADGTADTLALAAPLDAAVLATPVGVTSARLMRFDGNDFTEKWSTSTNLTVDYKLVEVLAEMPVVVTNL